MKRRDEPLLGEPDEPTTSTRSEALVTRIRRLVAGEAYTVLCTQGERQPYGSIVAYAFGEDLSSAAFATATTSSSAGWRVSFCGLSRSRPHGCVAPAVCAPMPA